MAKRKQKKYDPFKVAVDKCLNEMVKMVTYAADVPKFNHTALEKLSSEIHAKIKAIAKKLEVNEERLRSFIGMNFSKTVYTNTMYIVWAYAEQGITCLSEDEYKSILDKYTIEEAHAIVHTIKYADVFGHGTMEDALNGSLATVAQKSIKISLPDEKEKYLYQDGGDKKMTERLVEILTCGMYLLIENKRLIPISRKYMDSKN